MRSRYLAKQNRGVKFFELVQISSTRQDVIFADRDADLEVSPDTDSPINFTGKKLLQAELEFT